MEKDMKKYPYNLLREIFLGEQAEKLPNDSGMALEYVITDSLTEREALFLRMRYRENMTYTAIGAANDLSRGRAREIVVKAVHKLRHFSRKKYIEIGMQKLVAFIKESERAMCESRYEKRIHQLEKEIAELRHEKYAPDAAEIYNAGIEIFDLTVRTFNVLCRNGLRKVGDIIEADPEKIIRFRNLGAKSFEELVEVLKEYGFEAKAMELLKCYEKC